MKFYPGDRVTILRPSCAARTCSGHDPSCAGIHGSVEEMDIRPGTYRVSHPGSGCSCIYNESDLEHECVHV